MQDCVSLRSLIFDFGSAGPSKIEKHPIFDVFEGFSPITLVFLNRFTSFKNGAKCVYRQAACKCDAANFWGSGGPSKFEKHPIFDVFEDLSPIRLVLLNRFTSKQNGAKCVY